MKKLITVILCCLLAVPSYGAFGAASVWRISTVSSADTNGGAFDSGVGSPGTDESTSAGVAITITTASTTTGTGSPAFSATTHGPGNFVHIASGTGCTVGWYEIISQAAGTATFDKAMAAAGGDTCVGTIGGPFLTINTAASKAVAGNTICVKADGTYSISGGITITSAGTAANMVTLQGYTSTCGIGATPGDGGPATVQASANGFAMITTNTFSNVYNFILDENSHSTSIGINFPGASSRAENITVKNFGNASTGFTTSANPVAISNARATGGQSGCVSGVRVTNGILHAYGVIVDSGVCTGYTDTGGTFICVFCISANNTGATTDGFSWGVSGASVGCIGCISYGNGRDGFSLIQSAAGNSLMLNNWAWGNGGNSFTVSATFTQQIIFDYNAYPSGTLSNVTAGQHDVILTADPSTNGASLNFLPNSTSGGGAAIKGAAFPGSFYGSTGSLTIGAIQPLINSSVVTVNGALGFVQ